MFGRFRSVPPASQEWVWNIYIVPNIRAYATYCFTLVSMGIDLSYHPSTASWNNSAISHQNYVFECEEVCAITSTADTGSTVSLRLELLRPPWYFRSISDKIVKSLGMHFSGNLWSTRCVTLRPLYQNITHIQFFSDAYFIFKSQSLSSHEVSGNILQNTK